jgi:hypothetical protein
LSTEEGNKVLKNRPSVTSWKALHRTFAGVAAYISVASARAEICLLDQSAIDPGVCDGLDPQFETPSSTADGFTVQVSNYDGNYSWFVSTTVGSATISGTGLITVTGLTTEAGATVTVSTSKINHTTKQADVSFAVPPTPVPMLPIWGVAALSGMLTVLAKQLKKK